VLRTGLGVLLAVDVGLAVVVLGNEVQRLLPTLALLVAAGAGVALVQTPALTGATRSPAGQRGAGLGLVDMMRFVGGLVLSFLGRELADAPSALPVRAG
jgi:hypothetical protein